MNIFITGGAGFIGSHLTRALVKGGHAVTVLTRKESDLSRIADIQKKVTLVVCDIADREALVKIVEHAKPKGIFHLAASNIQAGKTDAVEQLMRSNVHGTQNLLDATNDLPYKFFMQTGSYLEYGKRSDIIKETDRAEPMEIYAKTKLEATLATQAHGRTHKKPTVVFRIFSPYGPNMQQGRLVREVITRALRGDPIRLTKPEIARDFIEVGDIVALLLAAMEKAKDVGGEIFNLGSGKSTSLGSFVDLVLTKTGSKSAVEWDAFPPVLYDTAHSQADMQKTFSHFAWRPKTSLEAGVTRMIDWISSLPS
ncbi:SDR family NAD(P)-dependent oxidoreductase [Candidatus Peregrinibacteria bacterium]|nr:SDR family NAD(P)-dependent oxidoreductase [Candidatus Peregrinibacteria bacterium]